MKDAISAGGGDTPCRVPECCAWLHSGGRRIASRRRQRALITSAPLVFRRCAARLECAPPAPPGIERPEVLMSRQSVFQVHAHGARGDDLGNRRFQLFQAGGEAGFDIGRDAARWAFTAWAYCRPFTVEQSFNANLLVQGSAARRDGPWRWPRRRCWWRRRAVRSAPPWPRWPRPRR